MTRLLTAARWSALLSAAVLTACPGPTSGGPDAGASETPELAPGVVTGVALDTRGQPIPDAKVQLVPALTGGTVVAHTGEDGRYRVEVLENIPYDIYGWREVTFNGERFCLRLGMPHAADYDTFTPREGAVRDFRWLLSGPIPGWEDGTGFGGEVWLSLSGDFDGSTLELTFTPTGPLLDGSEASAVKRTVVPSAPGATHLQDLPVANYDVTGTFTRDGLTRELHVGTEPADSYDAQTPAAALRFHPGGNPCISLASGVEPAHLFVESPYVIQ